MQHIFSTCLLVAFSCSTFAHQTHAAAGVADPTPRVIKWRTSAIQGYRESLQSNKPLVLVFVCPVDRDRCVHCKRFRGSLFSPQLQQFGDDAVFAIAEFDIHGRTSPDKDAELLATRLGIKTTPGVTILEPDSRALVERARLTGYFDPEKLVALLDKYLRQSNEGSHARTPND